MTGKDEQGSTDVDVQTAVGQIEAAAAAGLAILEAAGSSEALRAAQTSVLGKSSQIAALGKLVGQSSPEMRPKIGEALGKARQMLTERADQLLVDLTKIENERAELAERLDLAEIAMMAQGEDSPLLEEIPAPVLRGHLHLVTQMREQLEDIFLGMGYEVAEGPEAESDWYNFEALNMPPHHPARGMFDTFYLRLGEPETVLLRTHTSPVQVRLMEAGEPPIYAVAPGRAYRRDTPDATHLPAFHQIEGLVVDKGISFSDLAGTIEAFTKALFGEEFHSRLRPSFFPFTEPSAEFDVTCWVCRGEGCRTCSHSGWVELGGCGMVDPNVFEAVGLDPEVWSGFAFGFGIERLVQATTRIADMRVLLDNDVRFFTQF